MNSFNQFNIKPREKGFEGDKIKIIKIINREIIVHDFKIEQSKIFKEKGTGKCLHLQISVNNEKHIIFTSSCGLIDVIQLIPKTGFPFTTTIIQENERYLFT
jgi:hypothetical protein